MIENILVPVDGSEDANKAIEFAVDMAKQNDATIHLFHVVKPAHVPTSVKTQINWQPYIEHAQEVGNQILAAAKYEAEKKGVNRVETAMTKGDPAEEIINYTKDHHFDMVVMGGRGTGSPKAPGLGNVSSKVSHGIDQTCTIVRKRLLDDKKLLVVDDEPDILDALEELLPMCDVVRASSFDEAKTLLETQDFDMAILDIMGVDGYRLLEIANEQKVIAIMLTANALSVEDTFKSFKKGAASYVPKDEMVNITTFLEDILEAKEKGKHSWWRWFERLGSYYEKRF